MQFGFPASSAHAHVSYRMPPPVSAAYLVLATETCQAHHVKIETLKENNSSGNNNSAIAAQVESTVLNAINAHLSELADEEE